jgi:oxysterol 7-alpha-hydroxylase
LGEISDHFTMYISSMELTGARESLQELPFAAKLVLSIVVGSVVSLLFTYLRSLLYSWPSARGKGREPPIAPYWLPGLQHTVAFLNNPSKTFQSFQARYGDSPFTLLLGNVKFHVFASPSAATHVFARSRTFAYEPVTMSMLENGMNMPLPDRIHFQVGLERVGGEGEPQQANPASFVVQNHNVWLKYLSGKPLDEMMRIFTNHFVLEQYVDMDSKEWQNIDLYDMLRGVIFETSIRTFFGPRLAEIWGPSMWDDISLFLDATYVGVRTNLAYVLQPRAGRARERMLRAFETWLGYDLEEEWGEGEGVWKESWGAKMNWEREHLARRFGISLRGRACLQASFLFAIVLNAAPMGAWFTWCAASDAGRLAQFRSEASKFVRRRANDQACARGTGVSTDHDMDVDGAGLRSNTFMQALWREALRVGTAAAPARVVMEDTELEGYVVRKGSVVLMPTALLHHDPALFPDSDKVDVKRWMDEASAVIQVSPSEIDNQITPEESRLTNSSNGSGASGRLAVAWACAQGDTRRNRKSSALSPSYCSCLMWNGKGDGMRNLSSTRGVLVLCTLHDTRWYG